MAAHRLHEAEEGAREILAAARSLADSERGDALKAGLRAADVEASQIVARAEADAREDRRDAVAQRLPGLVDEVVDARARGVAMAAAWVAGSVRAQLLLQHRAGPETALPWRRPARWRTRVGLLSTADVVRGRHTARASRRRSGRSRPTLALRIRLLAAWLPPGGAAALRALAAWFELANIEDRLAYFAGARAPLPVRARDPLLGLDRRRPPRRARASCGRCSPARPGAIPGSDEPDDVHLALRLAWARRVSAQVPEGARLGGGRGRARSSPAELFVAGRPVDDDLGRRVRLGGSWVGGPRTIAELRELLPGRRGLGARRRRRARGSLAGRARLVAQSRADAKQLRGARLGGGEVVVGVVALLAVDAMLLAVALAAAAQGGRATARGGARCPLLTSSCRRG